MASSTEYALLTRVEAFIRNHDLFDSGQHVVVGVSGGVDSMVLADVLHRLGYQLLVAHVNYGLRGADADADETLVRTWCAAQEPEIPIRVTHCDPGAKAEDESLSLQEAAREQRYAFMAACAADEGADCVAVGHHQGDQAETLLLNLFRGSGVEGLAGMAPRRPLRNEQEVDLVRPLLDVPRSAIEAYAEAQRLPWRVDASNRSIAYDRNTIRNRIMPAIEEHFEGAGERIVRAANLVRAYREETFEPALEAHFEQCAKPADSGGVLDVAVLQSLPAVWRRRVILEAMKRWLTAAPYHAALAEEVERLLDSQVGRRVDVKSGTVWRERGTLRFVDRATPPKVEAQAVPLEQDVTLPQGTLRVESVPAAPDQLGVEAPTAVYADAETLHGPLVVRTWQEGDRFQPLGMTQSKKISDFLTDAHVPPHRRRGVLVVCDRQRIVWVVEHRLAHPVRIRPGTEDVIRMTFTPTSEPT